MVIMIVSLCIFLRSKAHCIHVILAGDRLDERLISPSDPEESCVITASAQT